MLQDRATNEEIRIFLQKEVGRIHPEGETISMIRLIYEHLGTSLQEIMLEPNLKPSPAFRAQINEIVREIHTGKPLQYILGYGWFCDLKILVNRNVLIPRPETEELVYRIRDETMEEPASVLDICSGSGCLALALKNLYPGARVQGMELSRDALLTSKENSQQLGLVVDWLDGDILHPDSAPGTGPYDLVVSNPPYVMEKEKILMESNVLDHEPHMALFVGDNDPLVFYRAITSYTLERLSSNGTLWLEINEALGRETVSILREAGFSHVKLHKDIHEKDRFIQARK